MATALEAAESLRDRIRLPKDMVSIWLRRTNAVIKNRKIIAKAKTTICIVINPAYKGSVNIPKQISGYDIERPKVPWIPIEGQDLALAEKAFMAGEE